MEGYGMVFFRKRDLNPLIQLVMLALYQVSYFQLWSLLNHSYAHKDGAGKTATPAYGP